LKPEEFSKKALGGLQINMAKDNPNFGRVNRGRIRADSQDSLRSSQRGSSQRTGANTSLKYFGTLQELRGNGTETQYPHIYNSNNIPAVIGTAYTPINKTNFEEAPIAW